MKPEAVERKELKKELKAGE
jgi:hypothetical protein